MTFIVALLRNAGMSAAVVTCFYLLLGVATVVSARVWSGLLDRMRGGQALAVLNALLAVATLLPGLFTQPWVAFVSGVLFGATFLSPWRRPRLSCATICPRVIGPKASVRSRSCLRSGR